MTIDEIKTEYKHFYTSDFEDKAYAFDLFDEAFQAGRISGISEAEKLVREVTALTQEVRLTKDTVVSRLQEAKTKEV